MVANDLRLIGFGVAPGDHKHDFIQTESLMITRKRAQCSVAAIGNSPQAGRPTMRPCSAWVDEAANSSPMR
jgi:hypothetical protein